jgi:molybdate transport system substrate-binding protein
MSRLFSIAFERVHTVLRGAALLGIVALPACAERSNEPLLVAAAASLSAVLPDLTAAFESETGYRVQTTTGASGQLTQQIREGAPIDVFLSADREWIERLSDDGRIVPGTIAIYARGRLVVFQSAASSLHITQIGEIANPAIRRIAIANPETAPYGRAARQALEAAGILSAVEARLVIAENVRQTVQYVETAGADLALTSEALMVEGQGTWTEVPQELYDPLDQALGVVANRPNEKIARAFASFVLGQRGREILLASGFTPPDGRT